MSQSEINLKAMTLERSFLLTMSYSVGIQRNNYGLAEYLFYVRYSASSAGVRPIIR